MKILLENSKWSSFSFISSSHTRYICNHSIRFITSHSTPQNHPQKWGIFRRSWSILTDTPISSLYGVSISAIGEILHRKIRSPIHFEPFGSPLFPTLARYRSGRLPNCLFQLWNETSFSSLSTFFTICSLSLRTLTFWFWGDFTSSLKWF